MSENKYLDYEGLKTFKNKLDSQRLADKIEIVETLNDVGDSIKDGKLTIQRNGVIIAEFTANLVGSVNANIPVPTTLSDLNNTVEYITNIIKYGQPDVSELTEELKEALHELFTENSGLVSESELESTLTNYGTIINYDSARQYILLKNGDTILSEFNAAGFVKDGMVDDVKITLGTGNNLNKQVLLIDFNTDSGITDIEIPLDNIFNASNYTKTEDLSSVAISGNYSDLNGTPETLTQNDVNTGTDTTGKLISAKVISDSINNALYGQGGLSSTVITTSNLESEALSSGFAKSIMTGKSPNTSTYNADANGVIYFPTLSDDDIKNIIKYGQSDISLMTAEERALAEENNELAKLSDLATVATSGSYNDLTNKPTLFSGSYNDLTDKPSIPNSQLQSDWNLTNTLAVDYIKNKPVTYNELDIKNIIKYGQADVSEMTTEEKESALNNSDYALKSDISNYTIVKADGNLIGPDTGGYVWNLKKDNVIVSTVTIPRPINTLSDWNQTDTESLDYIKNKPTVYTLLDIQNIIKYGLADITGMTESEKEQAQNNSEYALKSDLANFVSNENSILYLSNEKIKNIILGNESVLSLFYLGIQLNDDFFDFNGDGTVNILETSNGLLPYALGFINDYAKKYYNKESNFENIQSDWNATDGDALILNKPTSLPASDVYDWAKTVSKPDYNLDEVSDGTSRKLITNYSNLNYTGSSITSGGGQIILDGYTYNLYKITSSASISGISFSKVPENYHSCHIMIKSSNSEDISVSISNGATVIFNEQTFTIVCPENGTDMSLSLSPGDYIEFDIIRLDNELFVRGV